MTTLDTAITIVQLFTALMPAIGVLAFLLLHRRQGIRADLLELGMRHEHEQVLRLQAAKQSAAVSAALQAYAPAVTAMANIALAKRKKPTAAELSDAELVAEFRRRSAGEVFECECDDCDPHPASDDPITNPIN